MVKTELGFLKIGDTFYYKEQKYKAISLGNKEINNVCCINLETKKKIWLDVMSEVNVNKRGTQHEL